MRAHVVLATIILTCSLIAASSASPSLESLHQWDPSASWEGDRDADPRFDSPVSFWRAGLSLEEVFAGVEQQTGVRLSFYPEDDVNRRVRVHLFLNPKKPPSLRELMTQLAWVVDCPFFLGDEPEAKTYYLMSTSIAGGASEDLAARVEAIRKAREGRWRDIGVKVQEYRRALDLGREELLEKHREVDDLLLLNLLDPARRAATQFLCRHADDRFFMPPDGPGEHGELVGFGTTVPSSAFTPEDIAELTAAFGIPESVLRDPDMAFDLYVEAAGRLTLGASPEYTQKPGQATKMRIGPYVIADLTEGFELSTEEQLALRQALGEKMPTDEEGSYLRDLKQQLAAAKQERARRRIQAERALSPRAEEELAAISVTLRDTDPQRSAAPWIAQETVARATDRHVVSDGMVWSGRWGYPPFSQTAATMTALAALDSFTHEPLGTGMRRPSWEWGDAGRFLRFRTADRAVWRAAMLPPEFVDWVDSLVKPHLPEAETLAKQERLKLTIPVGLVYALRSLGRLSDLRLQFGMEGNYGDPADPANLLRHYAIADLLSQARIKPKLTRLLASLSDEQWSQVKGTGLAYADLSPDQQRAFAQVAPHLTDPAAFALILDGDPASHYTMRLRKPGGPLPEPGIVYGPEYQDLTIRVDLRLPEGMRRPLSSPVGQDR